MGNAKEMTTIIPDTTARKSRQISVVYSDELLERILHQHERWIDAIASTGAPTSGHTLSDTVRQLTALGLDVVPRQ
jgi:hypothetical protein